MKQTDLNRIGGVKLEPPSEEDQLASLTRDLQTADQHVALLVQAIREHRGIRSSQASDLDRRLYALADQVAREAGISPDSSGSAERTP